MNIPLRAESVKPPAARPYRLKRRPEERVRILGGEMDLVRPEEVMWFVTQAVDAGTRALVANHNMHSLYLQRRDPALKAFFRRAAMIEIDSTPVIYWARLIGRASRPFHRCTYLDWRGYFWPLAIERGWRVFYLGGEPGVVETAVERLAERYPGIQIGGRNGFFDARAGSADNEAVLREIADFAPDLIFVGMGMPRQEYWIEQNFDRLPNGVVFSVGAAFDYEAGVQSPAPRWMGRAGFEWLFRLVCDPRRLFTRYCVEPWFLIPAAVADLRGAFGRPSRRAKRAHVEER